MPRITHSEHRSIACHTPGKTTTAAGLLGLGLILTSLMSAGLSAAEPEVIPLSPALRDRCVDTLRRAVVGSADGPNHFWPAMHAAEALTLAGQGGEVVVLLRAQLPTEMDAQRRCGLARELYRAGDRDTLPLLFETLGTVESKGRVHAAESLYKINQTGDGMLLKAAIAQVELPALRLMAAAALARQGDELALQIIRQSLLQPDRDQQRLAAWILAMLGSEQDLPALNKVLAEEQQELQRAYLIHALACLGDEPARKLMAEEFKSTDVTVRTFVAEFAGYCRATEYVPQLIAQLADKEIDPRVRAAQSLIVLGSPPTLLDLPRSRYPLQSGNAPSKK